MARISIVLLASVFFCGTPALAQPGSFFDDFDGDALGPHWWQMFPIQHMVSNSLLTVTGLTWPSNPSWPSNHGRITTWQVSQPNNFRLDVWMGWSITHTNYGLEIDVSGGVPGDPWIAYFQYQHGYISGISRLAGPNQFESFSVLAPDPGIHQFTMIRTGNQIAFYLNENHLATLNGTAQPFESLSLSFVGPYPGPMSPLYVDRVQVVPAPAALLVVAAPVVLWPGRRRRSC